MHLLDHVPDIDYEAHPAFAGLAAATEETNAQADSLIARIDAAYDSAQASEAPQAAFDRTVAPLIASLAQLADRQGSPATFSPFLAKAFAIAGHTLRRNILMRPHAHSNSAADALPETLRQGLDDFRRDGFCQTSSPALAQQVWRATWIERAVLRARAARAPQRHSVLSLHHGSPAMRAIRRAVQQGRLEALASAYLGKPVTLHYAALDYAHAGQSWFKGCYAANGLADSKTVYMHFDADADIIKALFYLHDVAEKDGPFSFVRGSHRWSRSPFRQAIQKGFDEASNTAFPMTADQLDYEQGYYRPRFQNADYKAGMLALPRALRGSTHFGDDVMDDTHLSDALLRDEHRFVSPAGTMVLFDGSRGIHRGSLTTAGGERWALQLGFKVPDAGARKPATIKSSIRARLSYLRHAGRNLLRLVTGNA